MPSFKKGERQLSGMEVEETTWIAYFWIYVERVIGLLNRNTEYQKETCKKKIQVYDKIVSVSCSQMDMSHSVILLCLL